MARTKGDEFFESSTFRNILLGLHKIKLTKGLMRLVMPFYGKVNHYDPKQLNIFAIGQSHLDSAWNWRWAPDTAPYKLSHTIGYNLNRFQIFKKGKGKNGYQDGYKFSFPAPAHYEYMLNTWPKSFEKLKEYVHDGRWELIGGMYVESDGNVPDGESLVRQRLYGQKFFIEHFGKKALIAWLPDTFGFCWSLPQILKKSGAIGFHTTKMTWNTESRPGTGYKFPFGWFEWQSPDGSRLISSNFTNKWRGLEALGEYKNHSRLMKDSNDRIFDYSTDLDADTRRKNDYVNDVLWEYGEGDGGHGPLDVEIVLADACEQIGAMQHVKAGLIYKLIQKKYPEQLPIWNDELYLEVHRGVQTTLFRLKKQNRFAETKLQTIEKLYSLLKPFGLSNPKTKLDEVWKKVLFNQFHDILPGSSIQEVYEDTDQDFNTVIAPGIGELFDNAWNYLTSCLEENLSKDEIVLFYPHHWEQVYPIHITTSNNESCIFYRKKPLGIGYEVISKKDLIQDNQLFETCKLEEESNCYNVSTEFYKCSIDKANASIFHLVLTNDPDKNEFASTNLNCLRLFEDNPRENDAWNVDPFYREHPCQPIKIESCKVLDMNPNLDLVFNFSIGVNSKGVFTYHFCSALEYITCDLNIEWNEEHKLLRVEFDTSLNGENYTTGIPYGWINRPTNPTLPLQKGRWEVPGAKFISLGSKSGDYGLSVFVIDRYGFHCEGSQFGISLLRAPSYGDPSSDACAWFDPKDPSNQYRKKIKDLGTHSLKWAVYPHINSWDNANVFQKSMSFNFPVEIFELATSISPLQNSAETKIPLQKLPKTYFPIQFEGDHIQFSVMKALYDENGSQSHTGYIIRFFEFLGKPTQGSLKWNILKNAQVQECNLLECPIESEYNWKHEDQVLSFEIQPFEIKSFRIILQ